MTGFIKANALSSGVAGGTGRPVAQTSIPYNFTGILEASSSPAVTPHVNTQIVGFSATLLTAGTTASTVDLLVNGLAVATLTLGAGVKYTYTAIGGGGVLLVARHDTYSVAISLAGTGAANLGGEIEIGGG